ncbi:hypothetical protein SAMN04488074_113153 [Lentzea albidocapillata subsp. violacea]|uniref:PH domain-containing protein n=1 Tax=Lentzea albidocapillata subsp. violacea TaxID=128104 RepID=A0A1G9MWY2_9PSEU|nr:hypothetical protein [Lentzea albidocapillata]SDL78427.1 hypothetical protein SAMN04488074_113153 [Lentzea albidocapillata subsp. violacea]
MVEIPYGKRMKPRYVRFLIITVVGVALVAFALDIPWLLITLIVLGVLNTVVCVGSLYVLTKQPHTISDDELRLRQLGFFDWSIPTADLGSAQIAERTHKGQRSVEVIGDALVIQSLTRTNVSVPFHEPQLVDLGKTGVQRVERVEFWADEPEKAVREINARTT